MRLCRRAARRWIVELPCLQSAVFWVFIVLVVDAALVLWLGSVFGTAGTQPVFNPHCLTTGRQARVSSRTPLDLVIVWHNNTMQPGTTAEDALRFSLRSLHKHSLARRARLIHLVMHLGVDQSVPSFLQLPHPQVRQSLVLLVYFSHHAIVFA